MNTRIKDNLKKDINIKLSRLFCTNASINASNIMGDKRAIRLMVVAFAAYGDQLVLKSKFSDCLFLNYLAQVTFCCYL